MFKKAREARRRHDQITNAARHLVKPGMHIDSCARVSPDEVIVLAYGRHQIRVTADEARDALGAALLEMGLGLDRMTTP